MATKTAPSRSKQVTLRKLDAELFGRVPEGSLIVAFRNVLAHGYATLDHRRVYDAATTKVSALMAAIGNVLDEFPAG